MKKIIFILLILQCILLKSYADWIQHIVVVGAPVNSLEINGSIIFAGINFTGVYISTDNGQNWSQSSLNNQSIRSLAINVNNVFAGTDINGVYFSTNNGQNWTQTTLNDQKVFSLAIISSIIFAGTQDHGIYLSTNNGTNWTQTALNNQTVLSLAVSGSNIFAGTGYGIYISTNNGQNWTQTSLNNRIVYSLAISSTYIFAGTNYGVYISTNNGQNWTQVSVENETIYSLEVLGSNIFAGTYHGVYLSTNNGFNWLQKSEGIIGANGIVSLLLSSNYIFAGANNGSVYTRPLAELIGIKNISTEIPSEYNLFQNYPNPFNPNTKINFEMPKSSLITLKIFDMLGKEVATIVNETLRPGTYEVDFDGTKYPSGTYFYTLTTDGFRETKAMVLLK